MIASSIVKSLTSIFVGVLSIFRGAENEGLLGLSGGTSFGGVSFEYLSTVF
jgi:hypothetical protein